MMQEDAIDQGSEEQELYEHHRIVCDPDHRHLVDPRYSRCATSPGWDDPLARHENRHE